MTVSEGAHKVRAYYDTEFSAVALRDLRHRNARQQAVIRLCRRFVPAGGTVLEIGCGAGIVTRAIQRHAHRVFAVDLSRTNIEIASRFANTGNTEFAVVDVLHEELPRGWPTSFDAILLSDVVEHLPPLQRGALLRRLPTHLSESGRMILSFPTPEYQAWLRDNAPDRLQIVDEDVTPLTVALESELRLTFVQHISLWSFSNIYTHVVLQKAIRVSRGGRVAIRLDRVRRFPGLVLHWAINVVRARRIQRDVEALKASDAGAREVDQ